MEVDQGPNWGCSAKENKQDASRPSRYRIVYCSLMWVWLRQREFE
jgi:hypothetical protein